MGEAVQEVLKASLADWRFPAGLEAGCHCVLIRSARAEPCSCSDTADGRHMSVPVGQQMTELS